MVRMTRRGFLASGTVGAAAAAGTTWAQAPVAEARPRADLDPRHPNVLVIMVDEMRAHQWFPDQARMDTLLPNIARIRRRATEFTEYYTAANMCTPSRGALLTGLYPHQTGCMLTNQSTLSPRFPTWGTMMRANGYRSSWYGKWHLGHTPDTTVGGLEPYGFDGGTYPSPNGAPNQGLHSDPGIVDQFRAWFSSSSAAGPWFTTVSLVNPHDVQWWPRWTRLLELQEKIPRVFAHAAPNYETPQALSANKPRLQSALREVAEIAFGVPPTLGAAGDRAFAGLLDLYLWLQQQVDRQIGRVLDELESAPEVAANTIVVFTADHGDYAGSHGLHGKGGGAYDEAIRVPLYIAAPGQTTPAQRSQLVSSVDLAPYLLTVASGGSRWRRDPQWAHIAGRGDIASILADPDAPGRPWIAHVTDEHAIEEGAVAFQHDAPAHVTAVRTQTEKVAMYAHWRPDTIEIDRHQEIEYEHYDLSTAHGRMEIDNLAHGSRPRTPLMDTLEKTVIPTETDAPLPAHLHAAQSEGLADYREKVHTVALFG
ncbi:sulfatase-like hydrolase/transferase [Williamsia sp. SKLECPSW1]